jgi:hypothetical protein
MGTGRIGGWWQKQGSGVPQPMVELFALAGMMVLLVLLIWLALPAGEVRDRLWYAGCMLVAGAALVLPGGQALGLWRGRMPQRLVEILALVAAVVLSWYFVVPLVRVGFWWVWAVAAGLAWHYCRGRRVGEMLRAALPDKFVSLSIDERFRFPKDSSAKILTSGLLGEQYIGLEAGGDEKMLRAGDTITMTQSALVLENLISQFLFSKAAEGEKKP